MKTMSIPMKLPEYARRRVVDMVPKTALPMEKPERMASLVLISGFFSTSSCIETDMSTAISINAPVEARNMLEMNICVRFR